MERGKNEIKDVFAQNPLAFLYRPGEDEDDYQHQKRFLDHKIEKLLIEALQDAQLPSRDKTFSKFQKGSPKYMFWK